MNRLRMFGQTKRNNGETVIATTWPKASLMRKVGFIDRTDGSFYETEGIIQEIDEDNVKIMLLPTDTTEPIRAGDLVVMKSGTFDSDAEPSKSRTGFPPNFGWEL